MTKLSFLIFFIFISEARPKYGLAPTFYLRNRQQKTVLRPSPIPPIPMYYTGNFTTGRQRIGRKAVWWIFTNGIPGNTWEKFLRYVIPIM